MLVKLFFGVVKLPFVFPSVMLSLGGLALLVRSLGFFTCVKPCWAGFGVWWATISVFVSWCTLALFKLNFSCRFLFLFVLTGRWPLRCCLALLYHQIARHKFHGVSLGC